MRRLIPAAAVLVLAIRPMPAHADNRVWLATSAQTHLSGPWRVQGEAIFRTSNQRGVIDIERSVSLGRTLNRRLSVWVGYVQSPLHVRARPMIREHRVREQINAPNLAQFGLVRLSGRMRLETRWREGVQGAAWRARPQVRASLPLSHGHALNLSNETFFNVTTNAFQPVGGLERTRTSLTFSLPLVDHLSLDAGYMNQHVFVRSGRDLSDNIALFVLTANF